MPSETGKFTKIFGPASTANPPMIATMTLSFSVLKLAARSSSKVVVSRRAKGGEAD